MCAYTSQAFDPRLPFWPVAPEDRELVDKYMRPYGQSSCQHSFLALYCLKEKYDSHICERDGFLFTLRRALCTEHERVYLAPMGEGDLRHAYEILLNDARAHGCRAVFQTVTKTHVDFLREHFPGVFRYTELRDYAEYLYDTQKLCRMSGGKLRSKRNSINKLLRMYGERLSVRPLTRELFPALLAFEREWLAKAAENHDVQALEMEQRALSAMLDQYEKLNLQGIAVFLDHQMVAFNFGVPLNGNCFDGVITKASRDIENLNKLVYWAVSNRCAAPYPYFNWEEDVGVEGLRNVKMQYEPIALIRKYIVRERDCPVHEPEPEAIPTESAIPPGSNEDRLPALSPSPPGLQA